MPRQGHVWWLAAAALLAELALVVVTLRVFLDWPSTLWPVVVLGAAIVVAAAVARRPAAGRMVLRATLVLLGYSALVAGVSFVVVIGSTGLPDRADRSIVAAGLAAAALVAVLAPGVRDRIGALLRGTEAGSGDDLRSFGTRLTRAVPMDELLLQMVEALRRSLARQRAEVWLLDGEALALSVGVPHRRADLVEVDDRRRAVIARAGVSGPAWARVWLAEMADADRPGDQVRYAPLSHRGELIGVLVVERGDGEPPFGDDDERVLDELARQVGVALHNVQLDAALERTVEQLRRRNAELQGSRARIVAAGDAERRRLERNLHDGAQQHLTGLSVKLQLVAGLVDTDGDAARRIVAEVQAELDEAKDQLRALAHGLFPPLLTIGGLRDALPAVAARTQLAATVELNGVGRYEPDTEAAVYFCCVEALQNAGKHAGSPARATVRVWQDGGELRFSVVDDGPGFTPSDSTGGHGLVNMTDRVGAVGGELTIRSAPGRGTTVEGRVPVRPAPSRPP